jgi:Mg2+/Co2+ transporter CorB
MIKYRVFNLKVKRQLSREYFTSDAIYNGASGMIIVLLHVQELSRLLQERGEPVLAIRISWISWQWVLVFEQRHFCAFVMRLTVENVYLFWKVI